RGRHQGRHRRLEEEARHRSSGCREGFALSGIPLQGQSVMATEVASPNIAKIHLTEHAAKKNRMLVEKAGDSLERGGPRARVAGVSTSRETAGRQPHPPAPLCLPSGDFLNNTV